MSTVIQKRTVVTSWLATEIDRAKRHLQFLRDLATSEADMKAGRVKPLKSAKDLLR